MKNNLWTSATVACLTIAGVNINGILLNRNFPLSFCRIRKHKRKKRGVDYSAEIPFEKKPAPGRFNACA